MDTLKCSSRSFDFYNDLKQAPLNVDLLCYCFVDGSLKFRILVKHFHGWKYHGGLTDPPLEWAKL